MTKADAATASLSCKESYGLMVLSTNPAGSPAHYPVRTTPSMIRSHWSDAKLPSWSGSLRRAVSAPTYSAMSRYNVLKHPVVATILGRRFRLLSSLTNSIPLPSGRLRSITTILNLLASSR